MKFILFNVNDIKKNEINKIELDDKHHANEITLSKDMLTVLDENPKGFMAKIKYNFYDRTIEKKIKKALDAYDKKWYYILSNNMPNSKYLCNKLESLLGYKLTATNELDNNIFKYIDEYLQDNTSLKKHETKVLLVVNTNKDLNFTLVTSLIKEYKSVNIYLNEKPSIYTLKKIKQINKDEGSTIEIVKKERKAFAEYNVVYFVNDMRENYPRLRLGKNALILDEELSKKDKYNSNIVYMNEYMLKENVFDANIKKLLSAYDLLELASLIRKIVNELDKL